jgi:hypothetical protein
MNTGMKKWIASIVIVAFASLLGGAAYPLHGQETPGAVEKAAPAGSAGNSGSILPWVLIGVGVVVVALVLILVVFKTSYDITGSWAIQFQGPVSFSRTITFTGTKDNGTWSMPAFPISIAAQPAGNHPLTNFLLSGTYTVSGQDVSMAQANYSPDVAISGIFSGKDAMTGTWAFGAGTWTWIATRASATVGL